MIFMGLLMFTGKMNAITGYLSGTAGTQTSSKETTKKEIKEEKQDTYPATDFVLQDQYGKEHSLADYKGKTIFLNFWATWCGPCQTMGPVVDELAQELTDVKVGKVNVDEQPELAQQFQVMSIPTLLVMKDGKPVASSVGARPKQFIVKMIEEA